MFGSIKETDTLVNIMLRKIECLWCFHLKAMLILLFFYCFYICHYKDKENITKHIIKKMKSLKTKKNTTKYFATECYINWNTKKYYFHITEVLHGIFWTQLKEKNVYLHDKKDKVNS